MISVIMPSLNVNKYIGKCLESVCKQSYLDLEILCIDAGSSDGTIETIKRFADKDDRIHLIHSEKKSYGYQMNLGLDAANGEYIGIVETDDYIEESMYEKLFEIAINNDVDFVKSAFSIFANGATKKLEIKRTNCALQDIFGRKLDLDNNPQFRMVDLTHIWTGLYRADFLRARNIRFNETPGASYQDTSFSILVGALAKNCIYTDDAYYHYRYDRPESSVKSGDKWRCVVDEFEYVRYCLKEHDEITEKIYDDIEYEKVQTYIWNMCKLDSVGREMFLKLVQHDVKSIAHKFADRIDNGLLKMLCGDVDFDINKYCIKWGENDFSKFIERGIKAGGVICVGAGKLFSQVNVMQEFIRKKIVKAVCDNNADIVGSEKNGYIIKTVEDLTKRNFGDYWLICSVNYSHEIEMQLISLGISSDRIFAANYVREWYETVW